MRKVKNNYVDKEKFLQALLDYKKACRIAKKEKREDPPVPSFVALQFKKIAEHMAFMPKFINYSFKDDMILDGIETCLRYCKNFNPNAISKNKKGNNFGNKTKGPFPYFTQIIFFAFVRRIVEEEKQQYVKLKSLQQSQILDGLASEDSENIPINKDMLYDNMNEFIDKFEKKKEAKKAKKISPPKPAKKRKLLT